MNRNIILALAAYLFLWVFSLIMSVGLGLGEAESMRDLSSVWLYARRLLLIIAALAIPWFVRGESIAAVGWKSTWKWYLFACAVGISLGFFNRGGFNPAKPETLPLALLHTFSMELFFRGFLLKTLADSMERLWLPLFLAAILYALYYLTMWSVWTQPLSAQVMFMLRFIFVGVLFGYAYRKSGSLTVNWMMHILTGMQFRLLF